MTQSRPTYDVYLDTEGLPLDLTSPIRTTEVSYYDSGIWIARDEDRIFVPYHQVEVIREVADPDEATVTEAATATEPDEAADASAGEPPSDPVE